jgi:uncharacterized protein with PQ loop repeat
MEPQCISALAVRLFGDCLQSPLDVVSFAVGLLSIGIWMVAQIPQLVVNYRNRSTEGLSPAFLVIWALGDFTNLAGCLLTGCLATQTYQAVYFMFVDGALCVQYVLFKVMRPGAPAVSFQPVLELDAEMPVGLEADEAALLDSESGDQPSAEGTEHDPPAAATTLPMVALLFCIGLWLSRAGPAVPPAAVGSARALLETAAPDEEAWASLVGQLSGWVSAACYVGCRLPQLFTNWRRGSTDGLAISMFLMAMAGNSLYALSILLRGLHPTYLLSKLPWLVGSLGTVTLDALIFMQHRCYRRQTAAL